LHFSTGMSAMQGDSDTSAEDNLSQSNHDDLPAPVCREVNVTAVMKAWKGYYCCVLLCHNSTGENAERKRF